MTSSTGWASVHVLQPVLKPVAVSAVSLCLDAVWKRGTSNQANSSKSLSRVEKAPALGSLSISLSAIRAVPGDQAGNFK